MAPRDVFISHSSGDAAAARELRALLESAGYSCWMAPDDIVGTETWTEQILSAIADSKAMIVLVSAAANRSPHVSREVNLALGRSRAVLPIRIEPVAPEGPLEYLLSLVQRLDAFPPPVAEHRDRILRRLRTVVEPATSETTTLPDPTARPLAGATPDETSPLGPAAESKPVPAAPPPAPSPAREPVRTGPTDLGPGSVVGAFTIESQLGEGGMATVYRARQDEPRRLVALKVIRADHAANPTYRTRFLEEKETLAALEHPSIVPIYAAGAADGVLYIAMRLVDGPDLLGRIRRQGHLGLRETVQILEPIADAVDYAHAMGVVHRDLKPSNIILDRDGRPYLTDFGLGKRLEVDSNVSLPGMAIGTLDYMAPEQFTGASDPKLAPAIDRYALGCVAFQCLTGQAPFVRQSPDQLMYAHAHEPPPSVRAIRPEYPPFVDDIFKRVLAKDPAARFGSAREFVAALETAATATVAATPSPVPQPGPALPPSPVSPAGPVAPSVPSVPPGPAVPPGSPAPAAPLAPSGPVGPVAGTPAAPPARGGIGRNAMLAIGGGALALLAIVALGASSILGPGTPTARPTQAAVVTARPTLAPTRPPTAPPTIAPTPAPATAEPGAFPNEFEAELLALMPSVVDVESCVRLDDPYEAAQAMVQCDPPTGTGSDRVTFFALYEDTEPLQADYDGIMSNAELEETESGCFDLEQSNSTWSFVDEGEAGPAQGWLGCYPRTEDDVDGVQYVWTYDDVRVLGLWLSPGYQEGLDFFDDWVVGARPE